MSKPRGNSDARWMRRALTLAERGCGQVHPNPMVGAVLIKGGRLIAEGFHRRFGGLHAEAEAFRKAGSHARGADLYVTLEPCAHWGKQPPCADAVIDMGVRRVVAAMRDPFHEVAGRGFARLRRAGIRVETGLLEADARELNRAFITRVIKGRPYVLAKAAMSLDGKIAAAGGDSKWITSEAARREGHRLRAQADAVAVGIGTVLKDDPSLTAHGEGRDPLRIVFDSELRIPRRATLMRDPERLWLVTGRRASAAKQKSLEAQGIRVVRINSPRPGIRESLRALARLGVTHLMVEGGGTLLASFFDADAVDELAWFVAPSVIGGRDALTPVEGRGVLRVRQARHYTVTDVSKVGPDLLIRARAQGDR